MTHAHAHIGSQEKARGGAGRPFGCGFRAPISGNNFQSPPTVRVCGHARKLGRRFAVGRFYSDPAHWRESMARENSGLPPEVIRAAIEFVMPQREIPAGDPLHQLASNLSDAAEVVHDLRSSIRPLDSHDANENGLTHEAEPLSPRGKIYD